MENTFEVETWQARCSTRCWSFDSSPPTHISTSNVFSIEVLHQQRCALIVYVPQRQQQGRGPSTEKAPLKPKQFVTGGHEVHTRGATAQGHQLCVQLHLVEVIQIQVPIP